MSEALANRVIGALRERGFQAFLVGGCVRDLLLGREAKDWDICTDANPDVVLRMFPRTYGVGAQFGVVLVANPEPLDTDGSQSGEDVVEVATFRADVGSSDGRHPDAVRFSASAREDVERRDFTINGMLLDTENNAVLDYVGGQNDLRAGVIRTIGEPAKRYGEDKLRMLRAVRFAARFDFEIEPATMAAIQGMAAEVAVVSRERVRDELTKMLTEGKARRAFELLDESGLLEHVLPEIAAMKGVEQPPEFHPEGDVWVHTLMLLEGLGKLQARASKSLAWGALLHDVGKPATFRRAPDRIRFDGHVELGVELARAICQRLRFSGEETEQIVALVDQHMRFGDVLKMKASTLKRFMRQANFAEHLALHKLDCASSNRRFEGYEYAKAQFQTMPEEVIRPTPLLTGKELIAEGYAPGPTFKAMLARVEDAQLEGVIGTREEAVTLLREEFT